MARSVLPIVGAVLGGLYGGPTGAQIGFTLGSVLGNEIDPLRQQGPRIGDISAQTSEEGVVIQLLAGTGKIRGNLIYKHLFEPVTVEEEQGKGRGPIIESERLYGTYAIGIGKSLFDGPGRRSGIKVLRRIWKRGVLWYDISPTSTIRQESAERAKTFRFHQGTEDQLPDSSIEAIEGVDNTQSYPGLAYVVFFNDDLTPSAGAVEPFDFECVEEGEQGVTGGGWLAGPISQNGAAGGSQAFYQRAETLAELPLSTPIPVPWGASFSVLSKPLGTNAIFAMQSGGAMSHVTFDGGATWQTCDAALPSTRDVTWNGNYYYCGLLRSANGVTGWATVPGVPAGATSLVSRQFFNNPLIAIKANSPYGVWVSLDDSGTWSAFKPTPANWFLPDSVAPGHLQFKFTLDSTRGYYTDDLFETWKGEGSSFVYYRATYSDEFQDAWIRKSFLNKLIYTGDGGVTWEDTLAIQFSGNSDNNVAWGDHTWAALRVVAGSPQQHFINVNLEGGKPGAWTEIATPLYGNVGNIHWAGPLHAGTAEAGTSLLSEVIKAIARRTGQPDSVVAVANLTGDLVRGLLIGSQDYTGADVIRSLCKVYLLDTSEYDGQIHFIRRGGAAEAALTEDDLVEDGGENDGNWLQFSPIEQPAKVLLFYQNADQNYAPTPVRAPFIGYEGGQVSEVSVQVPVVLREVDEAPQLVDKLDKIMRTEALGEVTRTFSDRFKRLVPGLPITYTERGVTRRCRITHSQEWEGKMKFTLRLDRQSDVGSAITAEPSTPPVAPPSSLLGPTVFVYLNIPAITDSDDRLGYRYAAMGPSAGWYGSALQRRTGAELELSTVATRYDASVIGYVLATLGPASPHVTDTTNVLRVGLIDTSITLETLSELQFLSEGGGFAIVDKSGNVELGQYMTAVDEGEGIFTLTTLIRGRANTGATSHAPGSLFVLLTGTAFVEAAVALLGTDLRHRAVSLGSLPDSHPIVINSFATAEVQTEMPVAYLAATRAGNIITATWQERRRLGTVLRPVRSSHWQGFRITIIKGATTVELPDQTATTVTYDATALGAGVTVRVQQINRFTGLGPLQEVTV